MIHFFGLEFCVVLKYSYTLLLAETKLENNRVKIYLQFYLKCLQNMTLAY